MCNCVIDLYKKHMDIIFRIQQRILSITLSLWIFPVWLTLTLSQTGSQKRPLPAQTEGHTELRRLVVEMWQLTTMSWKLEKSMQIPPYNSYYATVVVLVVLNSSSKRVSVERVSMLSLLHVPANPCVKLLGNARCVSINLHLQEMWHLWTHLSI